ncbi:MAG: hypothetical protein ACYCSO_07985 [Cuniculiplasma sp.]
MDKDDKERKLIIYAFVMVILLLSSGMMIYAGSSVQSINSHSIQAKDNEIRTNSSYSSILEKSTPKKNDPNPFHATHFQRGGVNVTIFTITSSHGYTIFTSINNTVVSWVVYHNNMKNGIVHISAMVDGKISVYSHKINESNMTGTVYTSDISNHSLASKLASAKPGDATYSVGIFGWAASFTDRELNIIAYSLGARGTIAGIAALLSTSTFAGIPVAVILGVTSAIMGFGTLINGGLALTCNNGRYIGMGFGELVVGCNPVPWYY